MGVGSTVMGTGKRGMVTGSPLRIWEEEPPTVKGVGVCGAAFVSAMMVQAAWPVAPLGSTPVQSTAFKPLSVGDGIPKRLLATLLEASYTVMVADRLLIVPPALSTSCSVALKASRAMTAL